MAIGLAFANEIRMEILPVTSGWRHVKANAQYTILSFPAATLALPYCSTYRLLHNKSPPKLRGLKQLLSHASMN